MRAGAHCIPRVYSYAVARNRLAHLVLAFTLFAAIAVAATGGVLLRGFRSSIAGAIADKQAFLLQGRAHILEDEVDHLQVNMMQLARSEGVDLADEDIGPEKRAVALTASQSAAFPITAAILDLSGMVVWSEPGGVRLQLDGAALVRQAIAVPRSTVTVAPDEIHVLVGVAARGAIVAIVQARGQDLLGERLAGALGESGGVSLFQRAPGGAVVASAGRSVPQELRIDDEGQRWMTDGSGKQWLVTEHDVGEGPNRMAMRLVQSADELERDLMRQFTRLVGVAVVALLLAIGGGVLFASSIARLERTQLELMSSRGLAAMGKTSVAVAHEVKNSLNGLSVAIDLLASRRADPAAAEAVHAQARREISRLRGVAEDLTLFSARPQLDRRDVDLNALCRSAVAHAEDLAADCGAEMRLALAEVPLRAHADEPKLLGVLDNLVRNGLEAMGPGAFGEAAGPGPDGRERRLVVSTRREGADALVEISDTGSGLRAEVRPRLFEPFVTTKRTGTGLGLAIARRVVEAHGGEVSAHDRPGGGTVFRVRLPAAVRAEAGVGTISG
jgi:signal transduction histidine kinase